MGMRSAGRRCDRAKSRASFFGLLLAALGGQVFATFNFARHHSFGGPHGLMRKQKWVTRATATKAEDSANASAEPLENVPEEMEEFKTSGSALSRRLRARLVKEIAEQETQVQAVPTEDQKRIVPQDVDLNGIDPATCIFGSIPTAGLSYGFWTFTGKAAEWFVTHPMETDFYPAQRFQIVFQAAVVGLSSLATGIFGFTALGIFLLGLRVTAGAMTGELDPSKKTDTRTEKLSTAETVFGVLTKDPLEVVAAEKERKASERLRGQLDTN